MPKIVKLELVYGVTSVIEVLENDIADTEQLIEKLNAFHNDTYLKGNDYDSAKQKTLIYIKLLEKKVDMAHSLKNSILSASKEFVNFMEDYEILDDSGVYIAEQKLHQIRANYYYIENSINSLMKQRNDKVPVMFDEYNSQDLYKCQQVMQEVQKKVTKLKQLNEIDLRIYKNYIAPQEEKIMTLTSLINTLPNSYGLKPSMKD